MINFDSADVVANVVVVKGGSPGLVAIGGDLCSSGNEFESQHRILDG